MEPAVGVGFQVLPTPGDEFGENNGELGGLLDGGGNDIREDIAPISTNENCLIWQMSQSENFTVLFLQCQTIPIILLGNW